MKPLITLLLKSSALVALLSCTTTRNLFEAQQMPECIKSTTPNFEGLYKISFEFGAINQSGSGLLLIKNFGDTTYRVVGTGISGMTYFDLEFTNKNKFRVLQIFKPLNKKRLVEMIKTDFQLLFLQLPRSQISISEALENKKFDFKYKNSRWHIETSIGCDKLLNLEYLKNEKLITTIIIDSNSNQSPNNIQIEHGTNNFKITLKHLKQ